MARLLTNAYRTRPLHTACAPPHTSSQHASTWTTRHCHSTCDHCTFLHPPTSSQSHLPLTSPHHTSTCTHACMYTHHALLHTFPCATPCGFWCATENSRCADNAHRFAALPVTRFAPHAGGCLSPPSPASCACTLPRIAGSMGWRAVAGRTLTRLLPTLCPFSGSATARLLRAITSLAGATTGAWWIILGLFPGTMPRAWLLPALPRHAPRTWLPRLRSWCGLCRAFSLCYALPYRSCHQDANNAAWPDAMDSSAPVNAHAFTNATCSPQTHTSAYS